MSINRDQAFAFIDTLWPNGHMAHLDNPTRTYFAALLGTAPNGRPYRDDDPNQIKFCEMAALLRQIADHIEISDEAEQRERLAALAAAREANHG